MVIREGVRKNSHFPQVMEYDNNPVLYQQTCTAIIIKLIICLQWGCHLPNHAVITPTHSLQHVANLCNCPWTRRRRELPTYSRWKRIEHEGGVLKPPKRASTLTHITKRSRRN